MFNKNEGLTRQTRSIRDRQLAKIQTKSTAKLETFWHTSGDLSRKRGSCDALQLEAARRGPVASALGPNYDAHMKSEVGPSFLAINIFFCWYVTSVCIPNFPRISLSMISIMWLQKRLLWTILGSILGCWHLKLSLLILIQNVCISRGNASFDILFVKLVSSAALLN